MSAEKTAKSGSGKVRQILIPTLALFLIALFATLFLSLVNNLTKDRIAAQNAATEAAARKTVFADAADFQEKAITFQGARHTYYEALDKEGTLLGYVFNTSNKGYGGQVSATVGVDLNGQVTGVVPGDLGDETPGLGQNASKPKFLDQFVGKHGTIKVSKNAPAEDEIQAMTSATITSTAVTNDVNDALALFAEVAGTGDVITSASEGGNA
ncbi:MAG: FMN-binding protein [Clostridia bacterium]|nr:FMN-binding protein [Clostridia bacterium]